MNEILMIVQTIVFTVTLVVLIIQTKHLQKTIFSSNYNKMVDMLKDLRLLRINNPVLAKVYENETKDLSDKDIQYHFFNLIVLSILETIYIDWKQGLINQKTWDFWLEAIKNISSEKSFRDMISRTSYKIVNPDFLEIVEKIINENKQQ